MTGQPGTGRRPDGAAFVIAALLAIFGAVLLWDAGRLPQDGGYAGIGPAAMPKVIGGVLILLAVLTALNGLKRAVASVPRQNPVPLLWIGGGVALQIALLHVIGFIIATGLLFAATARAFGERRLPLALAAGFALSFIVYGIFDRLLQLNLPAGPLETLIFGG
ncbi:tripartite tricarboxylate transporter TctB family protein [Rhodobacter sp. SY28-1]|uniref:tripartite tricarboxylate transporter TctB family protein n=1 Tax=Rhodobacter sp. SY28-1 TaxID=2562317 RepID=UPI0010C06705|nr:tripartite tricarboxylate transporter TctB family protein [Rhodobacter sp. SY28-1]